MELLKIISAMNSSTRIEILKILSEEPKNVLNVLQSLNKRGFNIKYRESVYKALETLTAAGLAEKYYDRKKGICYKLSIRKIEIDIVTGTLKSIN